MATRTQIPAWLCDKCGKIYNDEYRAKICCKEYHCKVCGQPTKYYRNLCDGCIEKQHYCNAEKISYKDYCKKLPNNMIWDGDDYYSDLEEMAELYVCTNKPIPDYVWGTEKYRVEIDIDNVISQAEEDSNLEDFSFDTYGETDSLRRFVKQWNEKNGQDAYYGEYEIAIVLTDEEKEWFKNV